MITIKPYEPQHTPDDIWAYKSEDPSTHTRVPLLNAVAEALHHTNLISVTKIAEALHVDADYLSATVKLELGVPLVELLHQFRYRQVSIYVAANPNEALDSVARKFGYASYGSLWRFTQRYAGLTPRGEKSEAGDELWLVWREMIKQGRSITEMYSKKSE